MSDAMSDGLSDGVYRASDGSSLGDWLGRNDQIDLRPVGIIAPEPIPPGIFDTVMDVMAGAVADALDPLQTVHTSDLQTANGSGKGALNEAMGGFGKAFGSFSGLAVILGVGYLIYKVEKHL